MMRRCAREAVLSTEFVVVQGLKRHYTIGRNILSWRHPTRLIRAVDDVSFCIRQGETLALVGESGSGKSTIGRLLLRLIEPTAGHIWFRGQYLPALGAAQLRSLRRHMQLIFQDPAGALNPRMRIGTLLEEPFICHRVGDRASRAQEVERLLALVGLDATHRARYPHELSGGQRQRVCIARALALRPSFLVCDEPICALDASYQAQIINLLSDLQEKLDLTYFFISHDLRVVRALANEVLVMKDGRIVEAGPTAEIFAHPQTEYTRALLDAALHTRAHPAVA